MKIKPYMWPPHVILSPSLLPVSPGDARFAVMAPTPPEAVAWPSRNVAACSAVGGVAKSTTPLSRARHLPRSLLRLAFVSFSSLSSPWMESEQAHCLQPIPRVPPPWNSNPSQPKFLHISSFLLDLSFASPLDQCTRNRWFCGRRSPVSSSSASTPTTHLRPLFSSPSSSNRP